MFSLRARWVAPVIGPPIDGGYVTVVGERIAAVGAARPDGPVEDLGDVVLTPGFVNAHAHLEFSDLKRPLGEPGMSLPEWIRLVIAHRGRGDADPAAAIADGCRESLAAGVTTVAEIATAAPSAYLAAASRPTILNLHEAIGFSAQRVESVAADVARRVAADPLAVGVSPHAPYSVHPDLVRRLVGVAEQRSGVAAMHLAESPAELELLAHGRGPFRDLLQERSMWDGAALPAGGRPMDYLRMLAAAPRALVVHGNYLADDELAFLAEHRLRMSLIYCPRTHARFGHAPYRLGERLAAGVRVALGTDSRASNPDLDLLAEARFAAERAPGVAPATWLALITADAAAALGLAGAAGVIAPGARADLVATPWHAGDPIEALLGGAARPTGVWHAGRRVVEPPQPAGGRVTGS